MKKVIAMCCLIAVLCCVFTGCQKTTDATEYDSLYLEYPDVQTPLFDICDAIWRRVLSKQPVLQGMPVTVNQITGANKEQLMGDITVQMEHAILLEADSLLYGGCFFIIELSRETNYEKELKKVVDRMPITHWMSEPGYTRDEIIVKNVDNLAIISLNNLFPEEYINAFNHVVDGE